MLFDTHCHLDDERFDGDRTQILDEMETQGITPCVVVGEGMQTSENCRKLSGTRLWLYYAAGVHPHNAKDYTDDAHTRLLAMMGEAKCVAWGEIGLDYYYDHSPRDTQRDVCVRQMEAARDAGKPVIFHVRDAHGDMTELLRARRDVLPAGVMHCYSGSVEQARIYLDMGFYISIAGPVTFKKAPNQWEVAAYVPQDRLLIETDSPYMAPEPVRGRRNDPRNVAYIAEKVAALRGVPVEDLSAQTRANGMRLFGIGETV